MIYMDLDTHSAPCMHFTYQALDEQIFYVGICGFPSKMRCLEACFTGRVIASDTGIQGNCGWRLQGSRRPGIQSQEILGPD